MSLSLADRVLWWRLLPHEFNVLTGCVAVACQRHSCTLLVAEVVGLPLGVGRCRSGDGHCQLLVESHHHTAAPGLFRFQLTDDRGMLLVKRR
jgi:hypothetical protein